MLVCKNWFAFLVQWLVASMFTYFPPECANWYSARYWPAVFEGSVVTTVIGSPSTFRKKAQ